MNVARAGSAVWVGTLATVLALVMLLVRDALAGQAAGPADGATALTDVLTARRTGRPTARGPCARDRLLGTVSGRAAVTPISTEPWARA